MNVCSCLSCLFEKGVLAKAEDGFLGRACGPNHSQYGDYFVKRLSCFLTIRGSDAATIQTGLITALCALVDLIIYLTDVRCPFCA